MVIDLDSLSVEMRATVCTTDSRPELPNAFTLIYVPSR